MLDGKITSRRATNEERTGLDARYGKIGISAVAAAVRCQKMAGVPDPTSARTRIGETVSDRKETGA